jgi:hypothetical protein
MNDGGSSCGSVRIDRLDPWPTRASDCANEVTFVSQGRKEPSARS